jgi:hypothetical protein
VEVTETIVGMRGDVGRGLGFTSRIFLAGSVPRHVALAA